MAERLEGRKLAEVRDRYEIIYRVDRFRRFTPRVGSTGRGLIQFWGLRAVYKDGGWQTEKGVRIHTLEVGHHLRVAAKARRRARA